MILCVPPPIKTKFFNKKHLARHPNPAKKPPRPGESPHDRGRKGKKAEKKDTREGTKEKEKREGMGGGGERE